MSKVHLIADGLLYRIWKSARKLGNAKGCWLWAGYRRNGYGAISVHDHMVYVHRAVFVVLHGQLPVGMEVCHHCDVKTCVRPRHLFAGTQADNVADMWCKGRGFPPPHFYGQDHPLATISDDEVKEIRRLRAAKLVTQRALARRFEVSQSTIWRIAHGLVRP